ncbi:EamA family transporter [Sodalis sp. C49]|uniref:EamA family transporter n=1 Tax=Sodalis sp. C49 TaxID=3228929 RepID=UPI0039659265
MNFFSYAFASLFFSALCSAIASIILKYNDKLWFVSSITNVTLAKIPAVGFYGIGFILYSIGLREMDVSRAYPIMVSFAVIQLMILGYFFGETMTLKMLFGALLVVIGIFIINTSR